MAGFGVIILLALVAMTPIPGANASPLFQYTLTPTRLYCPPTATGTSILPVVNIQTLAPGLFATSTPCPGGVCPNTGMGTPPTLSWGTPGYQTATPYSTVSFNTATPSPTTSPTPMGAVLQYVGGGMSAFGGGSNYTFENVPPANTGTMSNEFYFWGIMNGTATSSGAKQINSSNVEFKNVSGGPLTLYITGKKVCTKSNGLPCTFDDPDVSLTNYGSISMHGEYVYTWTHTIVNNTSLYIKPSVTVGTYSTGTTFTLATYWHISTSPITNYYTPTPNPTATATLDPYAGCISGSDSTIESNPIINGDMNIILTSYGCYTLVPEVMITLPTPDWVPFSLPETLGVPGVELCVSYYSFGMSVFNINVSELLGIFCAIIGAGMIYKEMTS